MKTVYKCSNVEIIRVPGGQSYLKIEHLNKYEVRDDGGVRFLGNSVELDEMKRVLDNAMLDPMNQVEHQGEARLF